MRKNSKGFTLIELLAVIVILGLLMAIAIPSVTKYITESRKKTLTNTMSNYATALTNQVNDMEYTFTETNTIYAVPIECVALERGGTNPFGEWLNANSSYWAYVLVQYDDATASYTYGFTFKDSAGYGLYPTSLEKLKENGSQVQTDLDLNRPRTGLFSTLTGVNNWAGFDIDNETKLVVLKATSEGETGDGKTTCTLCQRGNGYDKSEEEKAAEAAATKPCQGVGLEIGDSLRCGSEQFYVLKSDDRTVTALANHKIDLTTDKPKQNANADGTLFSENTYWLNGNKPTATFGGKFPIYAYGNYPGNLVYQYLDAYRAYLVNDLNVKSAATTLIDEKYFAEYMNCTTQNGVNTNCNGTQYASLLKRDYYWFTATIINNANIGVFIPGGANIQYGVADGLFPFGVRPVIVIAKDDIEF